MLRQLQLSRLSRKLGCGSGHFHEYRMLSSSIEPADVNVNVNIARNQGQANLSGLQKQVLSLYRKLLRTCHSKDKAIMQAKVNADDVAPANTYQFMQSLTDSSTSTFAMRDKFRKQAAEVNKRDYSRIEHHIRQGEKYIKMLNMGGVTGMSSS